MSKSSNTDLGFPVEQADLAKLRQTITKLFDESELRTLCFDLSIDYENLRPGGKAAKVRELIAFCDRTHLISELIELCAKERPHALWYTFIRSSDDVLSPFKGLQYYDVDDAHLFFGREAWTARLVKRLTPSSADNTVEARFLAVVGASGSGKSSLVRAGLIPALQQEKPLVDGVLPPPRSRNWPVHLITPTAQPLKALATSLTSDADSVRVTTTLMDDMASEPRSLDIYVHRILAQSTADRLLIVIDQFEELFALCRDETERQAFIQNLMTAVSPETTGATIVVIILRADFYHRCADYNDLRQKLAQRQEYIGPMSEVELRRAIQEPTIRHGWEIEDGLIDRLLQDVGNEPGSLPLLSHALHETWKRRQGKLLTHVGYQATGGVRGAIAQTAETTFNQLPPEQQSLAHTLFLRLTELGEGTEDTRRRSSLSELLSLSTEAGSVESVLKILADSRLITTSWDTVEVAHEALIREWPRLHNWLDEDRAALRTHRNLTEAAYEWDRNEQDDSYLYRGIRLSEAEEWAEKHVARLNQLEQQFLETGVRVRNAEQRKARRRVQHIITGLALAVVIFIALALIAFQQRNDAIALQNSIVVQELTTNVHNQIGQDNELALLLALEAVTRDHTFETEEALRQALRQPIATTPAIKHPGLRVMMFSPDGQKLLTAGDDTLARIWRWPEEEELVVLEGHTGWIVDVDFSPDGKQVVTASIDGTARLWDAVTGNEIAVMGGFEDFVQSRIWKVKYSPDGSLIVTGRADGETSVWNATNGQFIRNLPAHSQDITAINFSSDGRRVITSGKDGSVMIWRFDQERGTWLTGHEGWVWQARFSSDDKYIVTASLDGTAKIWDVASGKIIRILSGHGESISSIHTPGILDATFSPDDQLIATASQDGTVRVWEVATGSVISVLKGHTDTVQSVMFNAEGNRILTASRDGTARLWDTFTGEELLVYTGIVPNTANELNTSPVLFDPGKQLVLGVGADGQLLIWEIAPPLGDTIAVISGERGGFSKEGNRYVTYESNVVHVWDTNSWSEIVTIEGGNHISEYIDKPDINPDGSMIVAPYGWQGALTDSNQVRLWDTSTGQPLTTFGKFITDAQFSPDGNFILTSGWGSNYQLWNTNTLKEISMPLSASNIYFSSCENILEIANGASSGFSYWNISTAQLLSIPQGSRIHCNSDGRMLVAINNGTAGIEIQDKETGQTLFSVRGKQPVFNSEGTHVATIEDSTIRVWEIESGNLEGEFISDFPVKEIFLTPSAKNVVAREETLRYHVWATESGQIILTSPDIPSFNPDGSLMVTIRDDPARREFSAKIWNTLTGEIIAVLNHDDVLNGALFSPDGKYVLTSTDDDTSRVWLVDIDDLIELAESKVTRELTCEERLQYLHNVECPSPAP